MLKIRVALFDDVGTPKSSSRTRRLAADGGDWDRNNRLSAESAY